MNKAENVSRLQSFAERARTMMVSSACGPLIVAGDVMSIAADWDRYRDEADGLAPSAWLKKHLNKPLDFFERRARAVTLLGEDVRRELDHNVAVWVAHTVPKPMLQRAKEALMFARRARNRNILSLQQAKPIVYGVIGKPMQKSKACAKCARLEALLAEHGINVKG